jgi:hypothetical protein
MSMTADLQNLVKALRKDGPTTGISSSSDLNFYYLEQWAKATYPVFFPLLESTPRVHNEYNGTRVGGPGVNWKQITSLNMPGSASVPEGKRAPYMGMTTKNMYTPFRFLGAENFVTFVAQAEGLGFDDNLRLAQNSELHGLLTQEEKLLLYGNSGTGAGGNGYQLGTTPTPTATLTAAATGITGTPTIALFCVALTPYGAVQANTIGVALPSTLTGADSSTFTQNGGTAAISAVSNTVTISAGNRAVTGAVAAISGAVAYAWYVNSTDTTTANAIFYGVTSVNSVVVTSLPTVPAASQTLVGSIYYAGKANGAGAGNLTTDNSANPLDPDGILTSAFANAGNTSGFASYVKDLGGAALTGDGTGGIVEFDAAIYSVWKQYKASFNCIYAASNLAQSIVTATQVPGANGAQRVTFETDKQGSITAGSFVNGYRSKFSTSLEQKPIPVKYHPYLPDGVVLFDITENPYPAAGTTIPAVRRVVTLEDHFSIKWPYRGLQHEFGVYSFLGFQHYLPWTIAVLTGVKGQ